MVRGREGYTLVEAIMATTLGSLVLVLALSTLQTQSGFYTGLEVRTGHTEVLRMAATLVTSEIRSTPVGGIVVAEPSRIVVRRPLVIMLPCAQEDTGGLLGTDDGTYLYFPPGEAIDTASVAGYGVRNADGTWSYSSAAYGDLDITFPSDAADACADAGSDTAGATSDFGHVAQSIPPGTLYMLYKELELYLYSSTLAPSSQALYGGEPGTTSMEMVSGLHADSHFEYHLVDGTYESTVSGSTRQLIDRVRLVVAPDSIARAGSPPRWTIDIPLKNMEP